MKNLFILLCLALCAVGGYAQVNLVPNPSFEAHDSCPDDIGEINYLNNWKIYRESPDFFSPCSTVWYASIPNNYEGYQQPHSGNSYIGLCVYETNFLTREIAGIQLISPLNIGQKYYLKFSANLALEYSSINMNSSTNKLGLKFTNIDYSISQNPPINNTSDLISNGFITDTLNWTTVFGSFVADSAYSYLMIGNFYDNLHTPIIRYGGSPDSNSYYFLDDICVSTDSAYAYDYVWTGITEQNTPETITIYPNPARDWITIRGDDIEWLMLYDVLGRTVTTATNLQGPYQMNVASLPRGLYFLSAKTKTQTIYKKIVLN